MRDISVDGVEGSSALADCLAVLERRVDGEVLSDRYSRVLYSTEWWI